MKKTDLLRNMMKIFGVIALILYFSGTFNSILLIITAALLFFLGMTNFGRECPLVLSIQYWYARYKNKRKMHA